MEKLKWKKKHIPRALVRSFHPRWWRNSIVWFTVWYMEFLVLSGCQTPQKMEVPHATGPLACCYWPLWATMEAWFKRRCLRFSGKLGSFFSVDGSRAFQVHPSKKQCVSAMDMFVSFCVVVFQNGKRRDVSANSLRYFLPPNGAIGLTDLQIPGINRG